MQLGLPGLRQHREPQSGAGGQVGHMGSGAARDGVDDDPVGARGPRPGQQGRGVLEFVEAVDPDHPELPHRRVHHVVRAGELAGVRGRRTRPGLGAAHLHGDDRHPAAGGAVGGEEEGTAVLEALDVAGDGTGAGPLGEVRDDVGGLQVGLVAGRRPVGEPDAEFMEGEHRAALVAGLGDQGDGRAGQVVAELLEGVQVGVRAEEPEPRPLHGGRQPVLCLGARRPRLREPGGEGHRELRLRRAQFLDHRHGVRDQQDGDVDRFGQFGDGAEAGEAEDGRPGRMHRVEPGADPLGPGHQLPGDAGVGPPLQVRRAHHGDRLGAEEAVQVGYVGVQWAAADVEVVHIGRRTAVYGVAGPWFAAGDDPGPAGVGGEGAVG